MISWLRKIQSHISGHRVAFLFMFSTTVKSGAQIISGFFLVRYISPKDLGFWNSITLISTYAVLVQAGIINGLNRELPFYLGSGNQIKAHRLAGAAQTFTGIGCLLSAIAGLVALGFYLSNDIYTIYAIIGIIVVVVTSLYSNYITSTFRSTNSFSNLSKTQLITSLLSIFTIPVVIFWEYEGMLGRVIVLSIVGVVLLHWIRPIKIGFVWTRKEYSELLAVGLPIFALSYVESVASTCDRLALLKFGGVEAVGYYSLALMIWQGLTIIPLSLTQYFYPRMTFKIGKGDDPKDLWKLVVRATIAVCLIVLPMIIVGQILLPILTPYFFPKYVPGIRAAQIHMWGALFYVATIGVNLLWSMKAWRYMIGYQVPTAAFKAVGPFAGAFLFADKLSGVAIGTVVAHACSFVLGLILTYVVTHRTRSPQVGHCRVL